MITKKATIKSKVQNWVVVDRRKMESEFGVHVNQISIVAHLTSKVRVLKLLAMMTKRDLSHMVVSQFDIINGKPRKYQIGVPGPEFLLKESKIISLN